MILDFFANSLSVEVDDQSLRQPLASAEGRIYPILGRSWPQGVGSNDGACIYQFQYHG